MDVITGKTANWVLGPQQETAAVAIQHWFDHWNGAQNAAPIDVKQLFVLAGYAGTGKTFVTKAVIDRIGARATFMAYTGKAALVMQRYGGVPARTIHSSIYRLRQTPDSIFQELYRKRDEAGDDDAKKIFQAEINQLMKPAFELNPEAFKDSGVDLIVLDECSMVDEQILRDLESFQLPILALGDPGQLPPIHGTGALFKGLPDAQLTEIRRQALDNPIIQWSMWAREKRALPTTDLDTLDTDLVAKVPKIMLRPEQLWDMYTKHDICICWKNVTRMNFNKWVRTKLGRADDDAIYPVAGDKLIITKNDRELGIFNGQFATVLEVLQRYDNFIRLMVRPEDSDEILELNILNACFEQYRDPKAFDRLRAWDYRGKQQADYGYAITCHKAQGSQWPRVLVIEENVLNWPDKYTERAQWLYTAITRAVDKVTIVAGK